VIDFAKKNQQESLLLSKIAVNLPKLESMLASVNQKWIYEDLTYRFYHQSFKVFGLQAHTVAIVEMLQSLAPDLSMNPWFLDIVRSGTGKEFRLEDNQNWTEITRPILEAFFHARYFLEMICIYGKQLESPPNILPSGWAAVLCLFNLR
jgi:hypothetical protein